MTYEEIADVLRDLPMLIRHERRRRGLSVRGAALEIGASFSTVSRWERAAPVGDIVAVLTWLDSPRSTGEGK